jgi:hypothetical protein
MIWNYKNCNSLILRIHRNNKVQQKEIVSHAGIDANGNTKRYPTLRGNELGYDFMPRLAKQVGSKVMLIPFMYLSKIGFALLKFVD